VFLFDKDVAPLVYQKNKMEFNKLIKTAILDSIRESIPVEQLLRSYLDESSDLVKEEVKTELPPEPKPVEQPMVFPEVETIEPVKETMPIVKEREKEEDPVLALMAKPGISFSDMDSALNMDNIVETIQRPKDIATLESISEIRNAQRKAQEAEDDEDKLQIGPDVLADDLNIEVLN
jgi:hypothetical protein